MKRLLLLMLMALASAVMSWSGQVFLDPQYLTDPASYHGNMGVNNNFPNPGDIVTLNVVPDGGYCLYISDIVIEEYDDGGNYVGPIIPSGPPEAQSPENYTFEMPADPTHDVHVAVTFMGMEYPVNGNWQIAEGSFFVSHINGNPTDQPPIDPWNGQARTGDTVTLTATPELGHVLNQFYVIEPDMGTNVNVNYTGANTAEFIMPPGPVDISASFILANYTITIEPGSGNGTIDVSEINGVSVQPPYIALFGDDIRLSINPDPGYVLIKLECKWADGTIEYLDLGGNFDMFPSDITLIPTFGVVTYTIEVDQSIPGGTVDAFNIPDSIGGPGVQTVPAEMGDNIQLSNTPARGYRFDYYIVTNVTDGSDVLFSDNLPGQSTNASDFLMPGNDVFVSAVFVPIEYNITLNVTPSIGGNVNIPSQGHTGDQIVFNAQPNPGYTLGSITVTRDDNQGLVSVYTMNGNEAFDMPPCNVTVTVTFNAIPYSIDIAQGIQNGSVSVTQIGSTPIPAGTPPPYTANPGETVTLQDNPAPGYHLVKIILISADASYVQDIYTNTFVMPPFDVCVSAEFARNEHKVHVQNNLLEGGAEAWWLAPSGPVPAFDPVAVTYQVIPFGDNVELRYIFHAQGYYLDHYDLYDANDPNTLQQTLPVPTGVSPGFQMPFQMPDYDVVVKPVFLPKDYNLTVEMDGWWGGAVQATNIYQNPPNNSITAGIVWSYNNPVLPLCGVLPNNHIFDHIQLRAIPDDDPNILMGPSFCYYILTRSRDNYVIGHMTQNDFTMPSCDVTISAQFFDDNFGYPPDPWMVVTNFANVSGRGVVMLHEVPWLEKQSKGSLDEEEQDTDIYGFARAVNGEPMHFVVDPNPGYQARKSDITVRLLDVTPGEGGDKGKLLKELKGGKGIEIFGPEEYVTELTDYYFIFDVPEGVEAYNVKVEIDVNFTPFDHTITVDQSIEHGTVVAPATAVAGETVTLDVNPDPGYRLESITVTPVYIGVEVTVDSNNQFVMPDCDVTVTATFVQDSSIRGDVNGDHDVTIADVSALIDYLLTGDGTGLDLTAANCNNDSEVSIADVSALIDYLLTGSW